MTKRQLNTLMRGSAQEALARDKMVMQNEIDREMSKKEISLFESMRYNDLGPDQRRVMFSQLGDTYYGMYRRSQMHSANLHTLKAQQESTHQLLDDCLSKVAFLLKHLEIMEDRAVCMDKGLSLVLEGIEDADVEWVCTLRESHELEADKKEKRLRKQVGGPKSK